MSRLAKRYKRPRLLCPPVCRRLRKRCLDPIKAFFREGQVFNGTTGPHIFRDNGANVLAVAHLDTVRHDRHFGFYADDPDTLFNCQLDDRLGAWIVLDALPRRGVKMDILLTTGEESCASTARDFTPPGEYNWMVEFDRAGTDVVTYQYNGQEWNDTIEAAGNHVGIGSYSDISELDHLGCCGVNWGIGYYQNHGPDSRCSIAELGESIERFVAFYRQYHDRQFPHIPDKWDIDDGPDLLDDYADRPGLDWWENTADGRQAQIEWREYYNHQVNQDL